MLNVLFPIFIVVSYAYAVFTGKVEGVTKGLFESLESTVKLSLTFLGTICFWNGIMNIAQKTSLMGKLKMFLNPIMKFLFPELNKNDSAYNDISMNIIANILGLGNAATPLGIKAMKSMQIINKDKDCLSNSMAMFILINTASIQLIPTTVIAIRTSLGSEDPTGIIFPVWIATITAFLVAIILGKVLMKKM